MRAGLGYRAALGRVAEELGGPISEEMLTALRQMELGASRRQAFLALRERSTSESLASFIAAQLQAEELGVPLSEALNDIAEDMRRTAHQNARRQRVAGGAAGEPDRDDADRARCDDPHPRVAADQLRPPRHRPARPLSAMAERIRSRGPEGAGGWLESACKLILAARAGILLLTLISLTGEDDRDLVIVLLVVAAAASFFPLRYWDIAGPALVRHPAYLAARVHARGADPAADAGRRPVLLLHALHGAARRAALRPGGRGDLRAAARRRLPVVAERARRASTTIPDTFQTYVGLPALYPLVAAAGAAARRLLDRQAEAEAELAEEQGRAAAEAERARLARDMHDSLAKTVSGIGFAALALSRRIERDPEGAADEARRLAEDARQATRQAREIIVGLRQESGESLPLSTSLAMQSQRWAQRGGVELDLAIEEVGDLHPQTARELEWILGEALAELQAPRARDAGPRAAAPARGARRAHGRRRRRRLRRARGPRRARHRAPLRHRRDARARAARRRRHQRRVRARRGLRALRLGADRGRRRARRRCRTSQRPRPPTPDAARAAARPLRPRVHVAMIRVLLVDDNAIVRRGIASLLGEADGIEVVGEAADGREAIAVAAETAPDVVCLDVRMPVMDGVEAAGPLSERARVLMLSYSEDEHMVTGAIRNGAAGYLVHGRFDPDELEARIHAVARGEMVLSPSVTPAVFDALRRAPGPSNDEAELGLGALTAREREVLNLLARGLSNRDIAEELVITNKTVKNHLSRIYEKIGAHSRSEAIAMWLGVRES